MLEEEEHSLPFQAYGIAGSPSVSVDNTDGLATKEGWTCHKGGPLLPSEARSSSWQASFPSQVPGLSSLFPLPCNRQSKDRRGAVKTAGPLTTV